MSHTVLKGVDRLITYRELDLDYSPQQRKVLTRIVLEHREIYNWVIHELRTWLIEYPEDESRTAVLPIYPLKLMMNRAISAPRIHAYPKWQQQIALRAAYFNFIDWLPDGICRLSKKDRARSRNIQSEYKSNSVTAVYYPVFFSDLGSPRFEVPIPYHLRHLDTQEVYTFSAHLPVSFGENPLQKYDGFVAIALDGDGELFTGLLENDHRTQDFIPPYQYIVREAGRGCFLKPPIKHLYEKVEKKKESNWHTIESTRTFQADELRLVNYTFQAAFDLRIAVMKTVEGIWNDQQHFPKYPELRKVCKDLPEFKELPSVIANNIIRDVCMEYTNFCGQCRVPHKGRTRTPLESIDDDHQLIVRFPVRSYSAGKNGGYASFVKLPVSRKYKKEHPDASYIVFYLPDSPSKEWIPAHVVLTVPCSVAKCEEPTDWCSVRYLYKRKAKDDAEEEESVEAIPEAS